MSIPRERVPKDDFRELRLVAIDRKDGVDGWKSSGRLEAAIGTYEKQLRSEGAIDFDDSVRLSAFMLEQHAFARRCLQAKFPYLLIDEYQDLGVALHRIAIALGFPSGSMLFAVGDPDQSIYKFNGSRPGLLKELAARPDVQRVELRVNYRSARRIILASHALLDGERPAPISSVDGTVQIMEFNAPIERQASALATELVPAELRRGIPAGEIAVLYPSKYEGKVINDAMEAAHIPVLQLDRAGAFSRAPTSVFARTAMNWCTNWKEQPGHLGRILDEAARRFPATDATSRAEFRSNFCEFLMKNRESEVLVETWIADLEKVLPEKTASKDIDILRSIAAYARPKKLTMSQIASPVRSSHHVKLMNLHTSKGTEHMVVFIAGCEEGRLPNFRKTEQDDIDEQRRLLFVGTTRAKVKLVLLFSKTKWINDKQVPARASRFLKQIETAMGADVDLLTDDPAG
ncbi:MAG: ATP-dependent helicase [Myxococcaceae bacterium]